MKMPQTSSSNIADATLLVAVLLGKWSSLCTLGLRTGHRRREQLAEDTGTKQLEASLDPLPAP